LPKPKQKTFQTQQNLGIQKNLVALPKASKKCQNTDTKVAKNDGKLPEIPDFGNRPWYFCISNIL
jgi:hypothetical protein